MPSTIRSRLSLFACLALALATSTAATATARPPVRILLVGDSTMAPKSGYGNAFCARWRPEVTCVNLGRGGRSTKSYRVEGIWDQDVMSRLKTATAPDGTPYAKTYVLMQFGHNDGSPKPERHADVLWEYPANLSAYAKEVRASGATFILVTPLTMRNFVKGKLLPDRVAPYAAAMHNVAIRDELPLIDLFAESQKAVQAMGLVKANHLLAGGPIPQNVLDSEAAGTSVAPEKTSDASQSSGSKQQRFDDTHLNQGTGAAFFGAMVADLLVENQPELAAYRSDKDKQALSPDLQN
jgi:lysophospholipase L1-like esterase